MTTVNWNGSKFLGQEPDSIEVLFERLKTYTLDPIFENYGNFVHLRPGRPTHFFGNFLYPSHAFSIDTDDQELIERLVAAIKANKQTPAYLRARRARLNLA
jgi:hypothetical protein